MIVSLLGAKSVGGAVVRSLAAVAAAYLSLMLSSHLLALYAMARFWEPWVRDGGPLVVLLPMLIVGLLGGLPLGAALAVLFRHAAVRVAALAAALLVLLLLWLALPPYEPDLSLLDLRTLGTLFTLGEAAGLLLGASLLGRLRRRIDGRAVASP